MAASFIPDGFTLRGYVAPDDGLHNGCAFVYRPGLPLENAALLEQVDRNVREERVCQFLADHLVEWDLRTPDVGPQAGKPVPINVETCGRIQAALRTAMVDIVMGWKRSDVPPRPKAPPEPPVDWEQQSGN